MTGQESAPAWRELTDNWAAVGSSGPAHEGQGGAS